MGGGEGGSGLLGGHGGARIPLGSFCAEAWWSLFFLFFGLLPLLGVFGASTSMAGPLDFSGGVLG